MLCNYFYFLFSAVLYPCRDCGEDFTRLLKDNPIVNKSRKEVINYVCSLHNFVNKRLKKEIFDCEQAAGYWGGDCGCSAGK